MALALVVGGALLARLAPVVLPERCAITGDGAASVRLTPEQAANAATIAAVSVERGLPTRAAVIGIATAMQESKLRNLDHGDRDSLGLFQQRPSQGWGTQAQVQDPHYASERFYDHLVKVSDWRQRPLTDVAQDVQRSGFPRAYAKHEPDATLLAQAFAGDRAGAVTCSYDPPEAPGSTAARDAAAQDVADSLRAEFGVAPTVSQGRIVVRTRSERGARSVAAWAVGHAHAHPTATVSVGGRSWTRGRGDEASSWRADGASGSGARTVVLGVQP
ncbi:hypothetical protein [Piscicoccus intestinalis]|uniref:hypothetical protein n=1 Tax=Piscicoccus intestinalis TaxID=746033 RepID=UPI000A9E02B7|nr:hypothetical protein [Piscicoccus intestinalis]